MTVAPGAIDLMIGLPRPPGDRSVSAALGRLLKDEQSREQFAFPAQHLFPDLPAERWSDDPVGTVVAAMDACGVGMGMLDVRDASPVAQHALSDHPDRFFGSFEVDPRAGMEGVRALRRAVDQWGVKAATAFPAGTFPQASFGDPSWYPLFATCAELGLPLCVCAGVPGPRIPMHPQHVERLDEVLSDFPELVVVLRHGGEPWADLAVKLMLKWPNLSYSTSAFAPRHYPRAVVDFANTRGADKVMYAGYFPMGLSLQRIFAELPAVPFRDGVREKFLRDNAIRVFGLERA